MADPVAAVIIGHGGEMIEGPVGEPLTFKGRGEDTDDILTAFENVIPPAQALPLHRHANDDESWYVLDGELRFQLDRDIHAAPTCMFVFVPRGTPHCFQNVADRPARILVIFTPSGMERFFDRFGSLSTPDRDAFRSIGEPLGTDVLGPTLAQSDPLQRRQRRRERCTMSTFE